MAADQGDGKLLNLTRTLADWIVQTQYTDLPASVLDATEMFITDTVGCIVGGMPEESSRIVFDLATSWGATDGPATVLGRQTRTSAPLAALINGTSGHALELDDTHPEAGCHCGVAVFPAALATAEQEGSTGQELLLAIALGYEAMARVGESLLGQAFWSGFHTTGILAPFGAAVASGKLLGLNSDQMLSAIGMAASQSAGIQTYRTNGSWNKRFHAGHGAMAGVMSAYTGLRGFLGPSEAFVGNGGWLKAYSYEEQFDPEKIVGGLGTTWRVLRNSIKPHACCRFAGCIVDAATEVAVREDLKPEDVVEVVVSMARYPMERALMEPRARKYNPVSVVDAQFSAPFAAALGIVKRRAFLDEFSEAGIHDPEVLSVAQRVRCQVDLEAERLWPDRFPCEVQVKRTDGSVVGARVEWHKGTPENPLTAEELDTKFLALSTPVIGEEGALRSLEILKSLRHLEDIQQLCMAL